MNERIFSYRNCKATEKKIQPKCLIFRHDRSGVALRLFTYFYPFMMADLKYDVFLRHTRETSIVHLMLYSISSQWITSFSNSSSSSSIITSVFICFKSLCFSIKFYNIIINSSSFSSKFSSKIFFHIEIILIILALAVPITSKNVFKSIS